VWLVNRISNKWPIAYQFWANVSDLYVSSSWSKDVVGLIIHKIDKKVESIVVSCLLYEHFHGNNPQNKKMQERISTKFATCIA